MSLPRWGAAAGRAWYMGRRWCDSVAAVGHDAVRQTSAAPLPIDWSGTRTPGKSHTYEVSMTAYPWNHLLWSDHAIAQPDSNWWSLTIRMDYKRADGPTLPPRAVWGCYHPRHARQGMLVQRVA